LSGQGKLYLVTRKNDLKLSSKYFHFLTTTDVELGDEDVFIHDASSRADLLKQNKVLHKKRVQLATPIWPPFHCLTAVTSGENTQ